MFYMGTSAFDCVPMMLAQYWKKQTFFVKYKSYCELAKTSVYWSLCNVYELGTM